jgi:anti-sigma B factor antagonist
MVTIDSNKEDVNLLIKVSGEVDASSSIFLDNALEEAVGNHEKKIVVDCSELNYISSAGLGVFMSYIQEFENNGVQMVLYGMNPKVKNTFEILGLDQLLKITDDKEQALALLQ